METSFFTVLTGSKPRVFIILTGVLGGGAAYLAGRALALKWRPLWQLGIYMALLAVSGAQPVTTSEPLITGALPLP